MKELAEIIKKYTLLESHKYGCVMATFDIGYQQRFQEWNIYNIHPETRHEEDSDKGDYHITVKYGIHSNVKPEDIARAIGGYSKGYIEVTLGKIDIFPAADIKDGEYDVVVLKVESSDLHKLNEMIVKGVKCTDTYPTYKPHVTLAYLKPGEGKKFVGDKSFLGKKCIFKYLEYSNKTDRVARIHFGVD